MYSCTSNYIIQVRRPAMYNLTPDLDTVVIVNRTAIEKGKGHQALNILEGIATGEPILGDKYGTDAALKNLERLIIRSDRLNITGNGIVKMKKPTVYDNEPPLSQHEADSICDEYGVDGLLSLEYFDSDSYYSNSGAYVKTFWRVYLRGESTPIIETRIQSNGSYYYYFSFTPPAYANISRAGAQGAYIFYEQIVPPKLTENRTYYTTGSKEMRLGKKAFKAKDIDQAIYYWEVEAESQTDIKVSARAAYNLALAYEIKGDLDAAIHWAETSIKYGNQRAISYKGLLIQRKQQAPIIEQQMKRE